MSLGISSISLVSKQNEVAIVLAYNAHSHALQALGAESLENDSPNQRLHS